MGGQGGTGPHPGGAADPLPRRQRQALTAAMHPLLPILACYGMGLALLLARGGGRDPLASAALAMPVGAAASALLAFGFGAAGLPLDAAGYGAAWGALFAVAAFAG